MNLNNYKFKLEYFLNGKKCIATEDSKLFTLKKINESDDRLNVAIVPNKKIELKKACFIYDFEFEKDDKIFVNGYQSWTTSREYGVKDKQLGLRNVSKPRTIIRTFAESCGDYDFTKYGGAGFFHSFTYSYVRNNNDKEMLLIGSMSEKTGYTIIYFDVKNNTITIEKDLEGLTIDSERLLCDVRKFVGTYDEVFDKYFGAMNLPKLKLDHLSGYTSWYNYFQKIDEKIILRDLEGITSKAGDKINIFQIDDGFESKVGDWHELDAKKFPNGLTPVVEKIHSKGIMAGLWLAPFSAEFKSKIAKEHPEWLIRNKKGKKFNGGFAWGGFWVLDFQIPSVREYIKSVFDKVFDEWGFDMVKLDFLYSACYIPRNNKTRGELMCEAMQFLRECCRDKLILGCGVPLGPSWGIVDACRISCDVETSFKDKFYCKCTNQEVISAKNAMNNSIFRRHLNHRVFLNDPDVFFLRNDGPKVPKFNWEQKKLLAQINNMFGSVLFVSDNVGAYGGQQLQTLVETFKKFDGKIKNCEYIDKKHIKIDYVQNNQEQSLTYNIYSGEYTIKNK